MKQGKVQRFEESSIKNRKPASIDTTGDGKIGNGEVLFATLCALVLVTSIMFCAEALAQTQTPAKKPVQSSQTPIEKRIGDLEKDVLRLDRQVNMYNLDALPDFLMLCDKKIPIFRDDVRERFETRTFSDTRKQGAPHNYCKTIF